MGSPMRESSQSPLKGEASLLAFHAHRERKQAEEDAIRLQNRIRKLNAEKERAEKLIEQTRKKAEELQKIKARCGAPPAAPSALRAAPRAAAAPPLRAHRPASATAPGRGAARRRGSARAAGAPCLAPSTPSLCAPKRAPRR